MHPVLLESLQRAEAHFRREPRCLGLYLKGSIGKGTADAYSDVDVALVVEDEDYPAMQKELRAVCEAVCGPIVVWLPEGETNGACNYAFLFEAGDDLLLYDFLILQRSRFVAWRVRPDTILYDPKGLLQAAVAEAPPRPYAVEELTWTVDNYWVYMYLNGKYFQRGDVFKMLYVQQTLLQTHLKVLNALAPETVWTWWANDIKKLPEEKRHALLVYFGATTPESIAAALAPEMDQFSQDARAACRQHNLPYPEALEAAVRKHLQRTGAYPPFDPMESPFRQD